MNTPLGRLVRGRLPRQVVVQTYKAAPFPPPWPLSARSLPNSKALALALSGYSTRTGRELAGAAQWLERLPAALEALNLGGEDTAWGYHFDAQTRHLFYSRETPNAVATCFVAGALLDLYAATLDESAARMALRARPFLVSLLQADSTGRPFFAYVPAGSELIHNANVMVAGTLARMQALQPDSDLADSAREATRTTLALQPGDGIWPYGERADLGWADNFHTAYIIESLVQTESELGVGGPELERAFAAWTDRFFGPEGDARFYPDRDYPLEAHSYASAIDCLCAVAAASEALRERALSLASRVASAAIGRLWLEDEGRFAFKRTSRRLNRREYMRWTNAPMFRALSRLASAG